ncbi:MAG: alpha/beta hydrolase [Pseudomonadota bacterium]
MRVWFFTLIICCSAPAAIAEVLRDIRYGDHPRQVYDLYLPKTATDRLYVIIHGGGWFQGDKSGADIWKDKFAHWGAKGIALAALNYRLVPEVNPFQQAEDIRQAIQHFEDLNQFQDIVLLGHSAGAHLALLAQTHSGFQSRFGPPEWSATIALDTSAIDVVGIMSGTPYRTWRHAFGQVAEAWSNYAPLTQLNDAGPPILIVCSSLRELPCKQGEQLKQKAKSVGQDVDVFSVQMEHLQINEAIGVDQLFTARLDRWVLNALTLK